MLCWVALSCSVATERSQSQSREVSTFAIAMAMASTLGMSARPKKGMRKKEQRAMYSLIESQPLQPAMNPIRQIMTRLGRGYLGFPRRYRAVKTAVAIWAERPRRPFGTADCQ